MVVRVKDIKEDVSRALANHAKVRVKSFTRSRTLRDALRVERVRNRWFIGVPHYWAVYYHDGNTRPRRSSRKGGFLVWYKNPKDDPRHNGRYPKRKSQLRSLIQAGISLERLRADLEAGRAVIAKMSPRSGGGVAPHPFFRRGLTNYFGAGGGSRVAKNAFVHSLKREMPNAFKIRVIKIVREI